MFIPIDAYVLAFSSGPQKFCRTCQLPQLLTNFRKHRLHRDGLNSQCTPCAQAAEAKHFKDHPDKLSKKRAYTRTWHTINPRDRRTYHRARYAALTPEQLARMHQKEKTRREANPKYYRARNNAWAKKNPDKVLAKARRWWRSHPETVFTNNFMRRARIKNAPIVEKINRKEIIERDHSLCHICKKKVKPAQMSLDHLIPLSLGGSHTASNLAVAHRVCNGRRGAGRIPAQLRLY